MGCSVARLVFIDHERTDLSMPLQKSHNRDLASAAGSLRLALARVHVPRLAADVRLINFNFAG
jgi:hypothetical protein